MPRKRLPTLLCKRYLNKQVKAWCPLCNRYHYHGLDSDLIAGRKSHRCAHCTETIFCDTGYYLKLCK